MKKLLAILTTLCLLLALPALAELAAADVSLDGKVYHVTLDSVEVVNGRLTIVLGGMSQSFSFGKNGLQFAATPVPYYGEEALYAADKDILVNTDFTFRFDRDTLPDRIMLVPTDTSQAPVLLWERGPDDLEPAGGGEASAAGAADEMPSDLKLGKEAPAEAATAEDELPIDLKPGEEGAVEAATAADELPIDFEPGEEAASESANERMSEATPTPDPTPEPTPDPTPEPTEEPTPEPAEVTADDMLNALGSDVYRATYDALQAGEVVKKGSKGEIAKGVQQTLVDLGQDIAVDGNVGPKSIAALNAVQSAFGLEQTEELDAAGYAALLPGLLISTDPDMAESLLLPQMGDSAFNYVRACAFAAQGKYASAKQWFQASEYGDWQARAEACVQPWPKNGVLYKNPNVGGSKTRLTVKFNTTSDNAMLVKIYKDDGVTLARTMFIGGTGKATTSLPAGTYIIKDGQGKTWYGEAEAFGDEGSYEVMTFNDGQQSVSLKKNYEYTITVNVEQNDPNAKGVGSNWENWKDF